MKLRSILAALAALSAAGCEQASQTLPFDGQPETPVSRAVPAEGGTISTTAGASVALPAGSVAAGTVVTLTPGAAPASSASGTAASARAFALAPAGMTLATPAGVDLALNGAGERAWLASLVVRTPTGVAELGDADVDLANGIVRGSIPTLGTVSAVLPEPGAVLRATALTSASASQAAAPRVQLATGTTRVLRGACGGAGNRCSALSVQVSPNLLERVDTVAVVFPRLSGEIRVSGASATGRLVLTAPVRARLASKASAVTLPSTITAEPTASTVVTETAGRVTLTHVKVTGRSAARTAETLTTLVVTYEGSQAWIRLEHGFQATLGPDGPENVTVAARIPLLREQ